MRKFRHRVGIAERNLTPNPFPRWKGKRSRASRWGPEPSPSLSREITGEGSERSWLLLRFGGGCGFDLDFGWLARRVGMHEDVHLVCAILEQLPD